MGIYGSHPTVERVPTDKVYPVHFMDSSLLVQGSDLAVPLVFDAVFDPDMLREALESLVKLDGWQRLGGRLRKNTTGKLEWHIPSEFTPKRPAINYTHIDHGIPAAQHPATSQVPLPSSRPALAGNPELLTDLAWDTKPSGLSAYLTTDRPVLGLRIHSFTDKTVVVFMWQHVAFDAIGMQYVLEGWTNMLWERADQIIKPWPIEKDPFESIEKDVRPATEKHVLADKQVSIGGMLKWILGSYGPDLLLRTKEDRMVCVPESYWRTQLDTALQELRAEAMAAGEDPAKVFLTENDIVTAFFIRTLVKAESWRLERTVVATIAMSLRKAFENDLIPPAAEMPVVGNAFGWANAVMTAGDVASKPLSFTAASIRRAINEQGTREQHEAYYEMLRTSAMGFPVVIFGDGGMIQLGFTNWSKAGLFDLDFSPARKPGSGKGPCKPSYAQAHVGPIKPVNGIYILGKDSKGNYWGHGGKPTGQWGRFAKVLDEEFESGT